MSIKRIDWPAPATIVAGYTTREQGESSGPYAAFNLALHVGDASDQVLRNRQWLDTQLPGKKHWQWLKQVHGTAVIDAQADGQSYVADACYSNQRARVCTIMSADCLPILLCDKQGQQVAAIHAGWRSLCYGVIENTLAKFSGEPQDIIAWLGPAIGPSAFEVGEEVKATFQSQIGGDRIEQAFHPAATDNKYFADLYLLATMRLNNKGVRDIYGGGFCTYNDATQFYSYRRDGDTGRMASFIYIK